MKKLLLILIILAMLVPGSIALAAISNAQYMATVRVTNNSTAASVLGVPITGANTTNLINGGYMTPNADNSTMRSSAGADVPFMPGYGNNIWNMFVESISSDSIVDYTWYNNSPGGKIRYFPGSEGMTTSDNATMELGDNFAVMWSAFFNTDNGTDKYIVNKEMSFRVFVSPTESGSIISEIVSVNATSEYLYPAGVGSETSIPSETPPAGTHWELVSDTDDGTYLIENSTDWTRDLYVCENTSTTSIYRGNINEVTFYFRIIATFESSIYAKPSMKIGDTIYDGTEVSTSLVEWATYSENFTLNPVTSENWTWDDIAGMEIGVSLKGNIEGRCSEVYIVIDYDEISVIATVTATGVSKGEHEIIVKVLE